MGPREEDNALALLVTVSLICAAWIGILQTSQSDSAVAAAPTVVASDEAVRVLLPFTPNTTPSRR
jgi:hypothetical protein